MQLISIIEDGIWTEIVNLAVKKIYIFSSFCKIFISVSLERRILFISVNDLVKLAAWMD